MHGDRDGNDEDDGCYTSFTGNVMNTIARILSFPTKRYPYCRKKKSQDFQEWQFWRFPRFSESAIWQHWLWQLFVWTGICLYKMGCPARCFKGYCTVNSEKSLHMHALNVCLYVLNACLYMLNACSYMLNACSYVLNACSHALNARSYVLNKCSYVPNARCNFWKGKAKYNTRGRFGVPRPASVLRCIPGLMHQISS